MALKPGPERIAESTGQPDQRQRDNKKTPGNNDKLKPSKSSGKQAIIPKPSGAFFVPTIRVDLP